MKKKRILLMPGYFGNGFGHIGRCAALGEEFLENGSQVAMVLSGAYASEMSKCGFKIFSPWFPKRPKSYAGETSVAYTYIKDASMQVLRDGLVSPFRLKAAVLELQMVIKKFKPDLIIGDVSMLAWITAKKAGIPIVQIIRSIMHPACPVIIWWEKPPEGLTSPDVTKLFNPFLRKWKLPEIKTAEDLLRGDMYIIPSIPELEPLPSDIENAYYVGAVVRKGGAESKLPDIVLNNRGKKVVYITLGGGAGGVGNKDFFATVNKAFADSDFLVIVSTGRKFDPRELPATPQNISYHQWLPGPLMIKNSDAVVFHGGYGTMMETVKAGIPSVVIPFHSEQESNGRRLAQNNASQVLSTAKSPETRSLVPGHWKYGKFTNCIRKKFHLDAVKLKRTVEDAIKLDAYHIAIKRLMNLENAMGGKYSDCKTYPENLL